jgi:hypothetical protein
MTHITLNSDKIIECAKVAHDANKSKAQQLVLIFVLDY